MEVADRPAGLLRSLFMSATVRIPKALHEILGREQSLLEIGLVVLAALGFGAALSVSAADELAGVPAWRAALAVLLIADIAAGCIANFTRGTDRHYAENPRSRWVFIAVHWHLVAIAVLLDLPVFPALAVTAYALTAASIVNLLHGRHLQIAVGASTMVTGVVGIIFWMPQSTPPFLVATSALFVVKVVFAFAVTHHGVDDRAPEAASPSTRVHA